MGREEEFIKQLSEEVNIATNDVKSEEAKASECAVDRAEVTVKTVAGATVDELRSVKRKAALERREKNASHNVTRAGVRQNTAVNQKVIAAHQEVIAAHQKAVGSHQKVVAAHQKAVGSHQKVAATYQKAQKEKNNVFKQKSHSVTRNTASERKKAQNNLRANKLSKGSAAHNVTRTDEVKTVGNDIKLTDKDIKREVFGVKTDKSPVKRTVTNAKHRVDANAVEKEAKGIAAVFAAIAALIHSIVSSIVTVIISCPLIVACIVVVCFVIMAWHEIVKDDVQKVTTELDIQAMVDDEISNLCLSAAKAKGYRPGEDELKIVGRGYAAGDVMALYSVINDDLSDLDEDKAKDAVKLVEDMVEIQVSVRTATIDAGGGLKTDEVPEVTKAPVTTEAPDISKKPEATKTPTPKPTKTISIYSITVLKKDIDEIADDLELSDNQVEVLAYMTEDVNMDGTSAACDKMIEVVMTELESSSETIGGEKYWSWAGFEERAGWCAIFLTWCGVEAGVIEVRDPNTFANDVPYTWSCIWGVDWFKGRGAWYESGEYMPEVGDYIYFDWLLDNTRNGLADHVGIVTDVTRGIVTVVSGNTSDSVKVGYFDLGDPDILGYGHPEY